MVNAQALKQSIVEYGYRMLDCASLYGNEKMIGEVLHEILNVDNSLARKDLFVVSKVWVDEVEDCMAACKRSLKRLGLDYIDLYLVHWPVASKSV